MKRVSKERLIELLGVNAFYKEAMEEYTALSKKFMLNRDYQKMVASAELQARYTQLFMETNTKIAELTAELVQ